MDEQNDFDGFSDSVGRNTITEELAMIRHAIYREYPVDSFSPFLRLAYFSIAKNRLKELKQENPSFQLSSVRINRKLKSVIVE
jgi:hypothetical protein